MENISVTGIKSIKKEGLILCLGDMNVDLLKWGDFNYYQKNLASQYQLMIGKCGLELLDFRITWSRIKKIAVYFLHWTMPSLRNHYQFTATLNPFWIIQIIV